MQKDPSVEEIEVLLSKERKSSKERQETSLARSVVTLFSISGESKKQLQKLHLEHNNKSKEQYAHGKSGKVKKTFDDKGNLIGAVKIMEEKNSVTKNTVMTEAKVAALMPGRAGKIFYGYLKNTKDATKWYVFMPWFEGITLKQYNKKVSNSEIKPLDLLTRLNMAKQGCQQLKIIHDHKMVLGDINSENLILSTTNEKIYLIDFSTAISQETCIWPKPEDDISCLGDVLADLFPELVSAYSSIEESELDLAEKITEIEFKENANFSLLCGNLIIHFLKKMIYTSKISRPNIDQCIKKFDEIININEILKNFQEEAKTIFSDKIIDACKKQNLIDDLAEKNIKTLEKKLIIFFEFEKYEISDEKKQWIKKNVANEINSYLKKLHPITENSFSIARY